MTIDLDQRPLLIAEIGNNHEGNADVAFKLADAAIEAGADAVEGADRSIRCASSIAREEQRIAQLTRYRSAARCVLEDGRARPRQGRVVHGVGV